MATTPEGKIKDSVKGILKRYQPWTFMPVSAGYGRKTLDFLGCFHGQFFAIETKAPGKKPTPLQDAEINSIRLAGGKVFVIDGDAGLFELKRWLDDVHLARLATGSPPV